MRKILCTSYKECMQIGVIGLNHKQASVEIREALNRVASTHFSLQHPFILLTTCNRTEIYFSTEDLAETQSYIFNLLKNDLPFEIGQEFYSFFGVDCFHHLSKVTSGFDSAIIAETEIQGQVKSCYQQAHQTRSLPFELHYLFQKALKTGKEIRTKLKFTKPIVDLEQAILHFGQPLVAPKILFVGASRTNLKIASYLQKKQKGEITFTNRTEKFLVDYRNLPWSDKRKWVEYDWVIAATTADSYQLVPADLQQNTKTSLLIDLSVPRNIDPKLGKHIELINIDQVNDLLREHSSFMRGLEQEVEVWVGESAQRYVEMFHDRSEKLYVFA